MNPLDADLLGLAALFLGCAGDGTRALELAERAASLKPEHPGSYHYPVFTVHYQRENYADALREAKRINMPQVPTSHLAAAAAAGQLGARAEASGAIEALRRLDVRFLQAPVVREAWALWIWDHALVERLVEGLEKALVMTATNPNL